MLGKLFVIFAVVPVLELYVLIKVGKLIGAWETVAILLAVSFAGAWLVRHQGFAILSRIQGELASGRLPAAEMLDGFLVLVGGILLLTPGFITDILGIFFIVPIGRHFLKQYLRRWLEKRLSRGGVVIRRF
ncbi:hypothetical protein OR1_02479 [Geobacter sp. OR-1]|uniref:FxsA family protein n=1 Tax=Geobacter sp. OR-1 TaxID=1266765 RepID=UPI0005439715|nr:FxsA family protein [Geobacter sp. OR-1]GAM10191.1 hypothetical protein OR1_02479 [Geobacter sp. OR-1]